MGDHPINLRPWQVRAAVEGRLSVLVVPLPKVPRFSDDFERQWGCNAIPHSGGKPGEWGWWNGPWHGQSLYHTQILPLIVGERYWARETFCYSAPGGFDAKPGYDPETGANSVWYRATDSGQCDGPWRSSTQLLRWASRITIVPTEVRVCRLHEYAASVDESEVDDIGFPPCPECHGGGWVNSGPDGGWQCTVRGCGDAYADELREIWNDQHGPGAYERNPWVTVARCAVHLRNIDALEAS